jgi:hypothetical protein
LLIDAASAWRIISRLSARDDHFLRHSIVSPQPQKRQDFPPAAMIPIRFVLTLSAIGIVHILLSIADAAQRRRAGACIRATGRENCPEILLPME